MIVPEDGASMRKWRISTRKYSLLKALVWAVAVSLFAGFVSFLALIYMFFEVRELKTANTELLDATSKIDVIAQRLSNYEEKEQKLRAILGGDLNIPKPVTVDQVTKNPGLLETGSSGGFKELEDAIAREEANLRRKPTIWPVTVWQISKNFSYTLNPRTDHTGIDIISWGRSAVVATADGKVTFADRTEKLGNRIEIDHGNGWVTEYGHTSTILVKYGDEVKKGQTIALYGGEDVSGSGPHLHYAMYFKKQPVDPLIYIQDDVKISQNSEKKD